MHALFSRTIKEQIVILFLVVCGVASLCILFFSVPPRNFPQGEIIDIPEGSTMSQIADTLYQHNIIRSPFVFTVAITLQGARNTIVAGDYYFKKPENLGSISSRFVNGMFGLELVKVTIPEGLTNIQIAVKFPKSEFPLFDADYFLAHAPQGYLFPDTYSFFQNVTAKKVIGRMQDVFNAKTKALRQDALDQKRNFANVVILASILEEEARPADMPMVAGVLANRLAINMPLQVDAATSTYKTKGIPLTPISNPGVEALSAALHPTKSDYLYYLSDLGGKIYYAKTFDEHQTNRELYLNK